MRGSSPERTRIVSEPMVGAEVLSELPEVKRERVAARQEEEHSFDMQECMSMVDQRIQEGIASGYGLFGRGWDGFVNQIKQKVRTATNGDKHEYDRLLGELRNHIQDTFNPSFTAEELQAQHEYERLYSREFSGDLPTEQAADGLEQTLAEKDAELVGFLDNARGATWLEKKNPWSALNKKRVDLQQRISKATGRKEPDTTHWSNSRKEDAHLYAESYFTKGDLEKARGLSDEELVEAVRAKEMEPLARSLDDMRQLLPLVDALASVQAKQKQESIVREAVKSFK